MEWEAIKNRLDTLLANGKHSEIRGAMMMLNVVDIAQYMETLEKDKLLHVFRILPKDISSEVFPYMEPEQKQLLVESIGDQEICALIDDMFLDDAVDFLEELPATLVDKILEKTPKDERRLINTFLNYPDNCAGSLMTPDYISLEKEWTVERALKHIKEVGMDAETVYTCYVKDTGRKLIGIVSLSTLVTSNDNERIMNLMHTDFVCVQVDDDQEEVSEEF